MRALPSLLSIFAVGHLAKSLMWSFSDLLFGYFVHVHLGLSASDTGWLIFISLAYSGCLDVLAAVLLSAHPGHEEQVPRLQFIGAILTALGSTLLFSPLGLSGDTLFYWLLAISLFFRTGYALYDIAQNALVSLLPCNEVEARRYVTLRTTLSYVAKVLVSLTSFMIIGAGEEQGSALLTILPIAAMTLAAAYPMSWHRIDSVPYPRGASGSGSAPPIALLVPVLVAVAAQICLLGAVGRFLPFAIDPQSGSSIGATLVFASVVGGMVGPSLADRLICKARGFMFANIGFTAICVISALVVLFGESAVQLIAATVIFGIGGGAISALVWSEFSAAVRTHALNTGHRADLASFALLTATIKLGAGGTGLFLGWFLDGYETQSRPALSMVAAATILGGIFSILAMALGHERRKHAAERTANWAGEAKA